MEPLRRDSQCIGMLCDVGVTERRLLCSVRIEQSPSQSPRPWFCKPTELNVCHLSFPTKHREHERGPLTTGIHQIEPRRFERQTRSQNRSATNESSSTWSPDATISFISAFEVRD